MIADDLDWCQQMLQDAITLGDDGLIWTRQELLDSYNAGYRQLLTQSQAVQRFTAMDIPGRFAYGITYEWEAQFTDNGTYWQWGWQSENAQFVCSSQWEIALLEGTSMPPASEGITQQWERQFLNPTHQYFRFALPRDNDRIVKIWYKEQLLLPSETRALDDEWRHWMSLGGEPVVWIQGVGPNRTYEIYEIITQDFQGYAFPGGPYGIARSFGGSRTYAWQSDLTPPVGFAYTADEEFTWGGTLPGMGLRVTYDAVDTRLGVLPDFDHPFVHTLFQWEIDMFNDDPLTTEDAPVTTFPWELALVGEATTLPMGMARHILSEDRQYLGNIGAGQEDLYGTQRDWHTSTDNLLLLEVIGPELADLAEDQTPSLLPAPMHKYLRYYVLARAWSRQGEGFQPKMAAFAQLRYEQGVKVAKALTQLARFDMQYARNTTTPPQERRRPPWPRLPSTYPRVGR